jgi:HPt (histidine-containing phosphotransfer) domain-containing protein
MQEALIDDDVLDEARLMDTAGGDRTLVRELAALFLAELPGHIAAIRSAVDQSNAAALQASAHALKGAAATLAAGRVAAISGRLESSGISAACAGAVPMLAELEANVGELQPRLIALNRDPS